MLEMQKAGHTQDLDVKQRNCESIETFRKHGRRNEKPGPCCHISRQARSSLVMR